MQKYAFNFTNPRSTTPSMYPRLQNVASLDAHGLAISSPYHTKYQSQFGQTNMVRIYMAPALPTSVVELAYSVANLTI